MPLHSAPDLAELISHIEAISTLILQRSQYHFSPDIREEAITQVKLDAVKKLQGLVEEESFDYRSSGGSKLATYLSNFAEKRALTIVKNNSRQNRLARKIGMDGNDPELRYAEAFEAIHFQIPTTQKKMVRPLQVLCAQLNTRLEWQEGQQPLKEAYENKLKVSLLHLNGIWQSSRREAFETLQAREESYIKSVTTALRSLPDAGFLPLQQLDSDHSDSDEDFSGEEDFSLDSFIQPEVSPEQQIEGFSPVVPAHLPDEIDDVAGNGLSFTDDEIVDQLEDDSSHIEDENAEQLENSPSAQAEVSCEMQLRREQRTHDARKRLLISGAIEYSFFPLQAKEICEIFGLDSISNGQKVRSRSREEFFDLLTASEEDIKILMGVFNRSSSNNDDLNDPEIDTVEDEDFWGIDGEENPEASE